MDGDFKGYCVTDGKTLSAESAGADITPEKNFQVRVALFRRSAGRAITILYINAATLVLGLVVLSKDQFLHEIYLWALALAVVVLTRYLHACRLARTRLNPTNFGLWYISFGVLAIANGGVWGATAFAIPAFESASHTLLLITVVAAFCAIPIIVHSTNQFAFYGVLISTVGPYAFEIARTAPDSPVPALLLCATWVFAAAFVARRLCVQSRHSIAAAILRDRLVSELKDANEKLTNANEARSRFLGHMSHELRTPLNAVIGLVEMLIAGVIRLDSEKAREYLRDIHACANRLLVLITDILSIADNETPKTLSTRVVVDLRALFLQVIDAQKDVALGVGAHIRVRDDGDKEGIKVLGDPSELQRAIEGMLCHALDRAPFGSTIEIGVERIDDTLARFFVQDQGPTLPPGEIEQAVVPFLKLERLDPKRVMYSESGERFGTGPGLGLPIAKQIIEAHKGRLELLPASGQGMIVRAELERVT